MAEQTTSSIVIDADPRTDHGGHRRLPVVPGLGQGRAASRTWSREFDDGWAERVFFSLDVPPIKDEYTLAYEWDGVRRGHLVRSSRARCSRALDGAYLLRDQGDGTHRGDLPPRARPVHPADRHDQAQGREDHHRHGAEGPEEARRVAAPDPRPTVRILLFTGKGGVGKSTVAAGTAALAAAAGRRTLRAVHRRRPLPGRRLRCGGGQPSPPRSADHLFVQQVDAQLRFEQSWAGDPGLPDGDARRGRGRPGRGRGAHRHPRGRGGAGPARAAPPCAVGRVGRHRRRLRAHGGDPAAAGPARGAGVVHVAGLPGRSDGWSRRSSPCSPERPGCRCPEDTVFDAVERLHRRAGRGAGDARRPELVGAAGADPGARRARRGPPLATRPCRCSATGWTGWSPTGCSPARAPTAGGRPGWTPRPPC